MQVYMEETEELLQKAEEGIIRLEMEYSATDVNELFRIAHTIKGSSHMVGYEDIGNLMHKIEDMLDCARNGTILFDQRIVSLCFEGLDIVKKMLETKTEQCSEEYKVSLANSTIKISETVENFIRNNKKDVEKKSVALMAETGIVSSLLNNKARGKNKYYITFFVEEDAPMISPVLIMILQSIDKIGTLVYSSFNDNYFEQSSVNQDKKTFKVIISTDIDEAELYTYCALFYVERINIVDISRGKLEENDHYFNNNSNSSYKIILATSKQLYNLLFNQNKEINNKKINRKDKLNIIKSLHSEAITAFENIKNENTIMFIKDFNELYALIIRKYDEHLDADNKINIDIKSEMVKLLERAYNYTKGKHLFCVYKSEKEDYINKFTNFIDMVNKASTLIILIDLSKLELLHENDVKVLIEIKKKLEAQEIALSIIAEGSNARRIVNIFDSIKPVEEFRVFRSEFEAIVKMIF